MWPWEISRGLLKCIYIVPYPAIIPPKPSPSSFHSFPFSPPSSSPRLTLIYHSQDPSWSLWSPSFISSRWFSRAVSATAPWRRCGYWRQAYGGLGTPPVHITPHEQPRGRGKGKKAIWPISNCILLPQRTLLKSLHAFALLLFPLGPLLH